MSKIGAQLTLVHTNCRSRSAADLLVPFYVEAHDARGSLRLHIGLGNRVHTINYACDRPDYVSLHVKRIHNAVGEGLQRSYSLVLLPTVQSAACQIAALVSGRSCRSA
jgi:hypothetical protein